MVQSIPKVRFEKSLCINSKAPTAIKKVWEHKQTKQYENNMIICNIINIIVLFIALIGTESLNKKYCNIISDITIFIFFINALILLTIIEN